MSIKAVYLPRRIKDPKDKTGKKKINGTDGFVYIRYIYQSKPTYFNTGVEVKPDQFNYTKQNLNYLKGIRKDIKRNAEMIKDLEALQENDMFLIEAKMSKVKRFVSDLKREEITPTGEAVKLAMTGKKKKEKLNYSVDELIKEFLQAPIIQGRNKGKRRSAGSIDQLKSVFENLKRYFEIKDIPLKLESFNKKFYSDYTYFLEYERSEHKSKYGNRFANMDINTRGNQIAKIKAFLSWIEETKDYKFDLKLSAMTVTKSFGKVIYLSEKELSLVTNCDLPEGELSRARDLFILHCRIGLRYSDLSRLGTEHIKGDTIELRTQKADTDVFIPLFSDAAMIIKKYTTHNVLYLPKMTEHKYNEALKEIGRIAGIDELIARTKEINGKKVHTNKPKYELLSSHKAVSTFITLSAQRKIPVKTIAQIVGKTVAIINQHYLGETDRDTIRKEMLEAYQDDNIMKKA